MPWTRSQPTASSSSSVMTSGDRAHRRRRPAARARPRATTDAAQHDDAADDDGRPGVAVRARGGRLHQHEDGVRQRARRRSLHGEHDAERSGTGPVGTRSTVVRGDLSPTLVLMRGLLVVNPTATTTTRARPRRPRPRAARRPRPRGRRDHAPRPRHRARPAGDQGRRRPAHRPRRRRHGQRGGQRPARRTARPRRPGAGRRPRRLHQRVRPCPRAAQRPGRGHRPDPRRAARGAVPAAIGLGDRGRPLVHVLRRPRPGRRGGRARWSAGASAAAARPAALFVASAVRQFYRRRARAAPLTLQPHGEDRSRALSLAIVQNTSPVDLPGQPADRPVARGVVRHRAGPVRACPACGTLSTLRHVRQLLVGTHGAARPATSSPCTTSAR